METKQKEQIDLQWNENTDSGNTLTKQDYIIEKAKVLAGGPLYVMHKDGVFDKLRTALKNFYNAWKNYDGKVTPMIPKAGFSIEPKQPFKNGGCMP